MQTARNPESTKNPSLITTAMESPPRLSNAHPSPLPHHFACQAPASGVNWRRTNRLFTLLCTAVQGPLKVSPWEHESSSLTDSITPGTSATGQEFLGENPSVPGKRKEASTERDNPTSNSGFVRSPRLQTSLSFAANKNRTHGSVLQEEALIGGAESTPDDRSRPSLPNTSDTPLCRPQVGDLISATIVDQPENCRGLPIGLEGSSSSSVNRCASAEVESSRKSCPHDHSVGSQMSSPPLSWSPVPSLASLNPRPYRGAVPPHATEGAQSVEVNGTPSSMSSSAAFESNMDDIEQYVGQDLEGYGRLSY